MKKRIILSVAAAALATGAFAAGNGKKVFINPGHGGYDGDDRNVVIAPYASGDPAGYWESKSNLAKGLLLRDMLIADGYEVKMSRTTNTSADDLGLSTISALANNWGADLFFSIHSNATGTESRRNFPLMLFRGYDDQPVKPNDKVLSTILNEQLLENQVTYWTDKTVNVRGDWSFYKSWGTSGLGVLRNLTVVGMLSEGSFHDYVPEAYRLMNNDFCWLEAFHFRRTVDKFFGNTGEKVGHIFGRLNDNRFPRDGSYKKFGDDLFATLQDTKVELCDATGKVIDTYTTDAVDINGVYAFKNLQPGTYKVRTLSTDHYNDSTTVTVEADKVTYANFRLAKVRNTPPAVLGYSPVWKEGDPTVLCNTPVTVEFNWDMDVDLTEKAFSISPAVEGTLTWSDLNYRLTFTPSQPYAVNTLYTVTIGTGAAHGGGTTFPQAFSFSFRTTDRNFMEVVAQSPKEGDMVHFHKAAIEMRFDKKPNAAKILSMVKCKDEDGNDVAFNRTFESSKPSIPYGFFRMPFLKDLTPGKKYTVTVDGSLADRDGITIQKPMSFTFTATDVTTEKDGGVLAEMDNAAAFVYSPEQSSAVSSQAVARGIKQALYSDSTTTFSYTFENEAGGEVMWNIEGETPSGIGADRTLGVHLYGDLSGNPVYFLMSGAASEAYMHIADMDFLGWRYIEVPVSSIAPDTYALRGIKVVQKEGAQTRMGTFAIERIIDKGHSGVSAVEIPSLEIKHSPDAEFIVANAGFRIEGISLLDMSGATVAREAGNVMYVGNKADGNYVALIHTPMGDVARKIIIKH